jgi:predicted MPP superfamily phosphohydrolase
MRRTTFFALLGLLFFYTGVKATNLLGHTIVSWIVTAIFFAVMVFWQFAYRSDVNAVNSRWFNILAWSGSISLGLWTTFMLLSIPVDVASLFIRDRQMFAQTVSITIFALSAAIVSLGFFQTITGPKVKQLSVPIHDLPEALQGLRIAQITDLHVGPTIHRGYVQQVVQKVLRTKPDLIAITGDMADGSPEALESHLQPLRELKAPLGTYYITGNHEYYWGAQRWLDTARNLGFVTLINENRLISVDGAAMLVAGVTDTSAHHFIASHRSDPQKAAQSPNKSNFKLLLAHRPDSCFQAEPAGFDLQLSGHTHGGQFFPWNLIVRFVHKYYRGLNRHGKMWVYVNAGTGYWGPAVRFAVPSEITLLQLVRS